jgi:hypothetical protein
VAARGVQPQTDGLTPGGPDIGEDSGEPGAGADVDRMLVTPAPERDVGDAAGQVIAIGSGGAVGAA